MIFLSNKAGFFFFSGGIGSPYFYGWVKLLYFSRYARVWLCGITYLFFIRDMDLLGGTEPEFTFCSCWFAFCTSLKKNYSVLILSQQYGSWPSFVYFSISYCRFLTVVFVQMYCFQYPKNKIIIVFADFTLIISRWSTQLLLVFIIYLCAYYQH